MSRSVVRFRRDANARISGVVYGNPVVRDIAFNRMP
jgi:hypothetical protein